MLPTEHYGLHWDGAVAWLLQGRGASNFAGLRAKSPFQVNGGMCNHLIPTAAPVPDRIHWDRFLEIFPDPLVQAMLPLPNPVGNNTFFVDDPYNDLAFHLSTLSRLSSPIRPIVKPLWAMKVKDFEKELLTTNVQPLVLIQAGTKQQEIVDTIGQMANFAPRTVVITGDPNLVVQSPMKRITSQIRNHDLQEIMTLPLENIGAAVLRRKARNEQLDAPMESRQARRDRQIQERLK